jgi:hypothetical protein
MSLANMSASGDGVVKTSGCDGCPDGTAVSQQQLPDSGGMLTFVASGTGPLRFVGLGSGGTGGGAADIAFAVRLQAGVAEVREFGAYRTETAFGAGDSFQITVSAGTVRYARNGSVFYSSASQAPGGLRVQVVFHDLQAAVSNVTLQSQTGGSSIDAAPSPPPTAQPRATRGRPAKWPEGSPADSR